MSTAAAAPATPIQALHELRELLASGAYWRTFQTIDEFRAALLSVTDTYLDDITIQALNSFGADQPK